ncbi:MAG: hypothetical protein A3J28_10275 [Acidobacteria bacterium RIFCSPLOWO2_12_FULL_60_22]|nr:MAG: hypothetical protein A3J28_10275 [Acidobacteria bacterium RIFCSPLOWO2_12_FULL_60_22]
MRVFLDACIDPRVSEAFSDHEVRTAVELGWQRLKDNALVALLQDQFDVLVTADQGFEHQQNLKTLRFGLLILHVQRNKVEFYRPLFGQMQAAVAQVKPGEVIHIYGTSGAPGIMRRA